MTGDAGPTAASTVALEEEANVSRSPREEHVGKTRTVVQGERWAVPAFPAPEPCCQGRSRLGCCVEDLSTFMLLLRFLSPALFSGTFSKYLEALNSW